MIILNTISSEAPQNPFKSFKSLIGYAELKVRSSFYSPRPISPLSGELEGSWGRG